MSILEVLTAQPQKKRLLAEKMGWSTREIELEVQRYRLAGIPIISDQDGYRIAQTSAEVLQCYRWLRSKYLSQARTAWAMKRAAARLAAKESALPQLWDDAA